MEHVDLIIIGAGPSGLSCAIEAQNAGLTYTVLEKGGITDAIRRFPTNMTFFSTPELLELGELPFSTPNVRPTRIESLQYYRRVVEHFDIHLRLGIHVQEIRKDGEFFRIKAAQGQEFQAKCVVIATGYFDFTNRLNISGENLPHVSYYYDEPYRYAHTDVVVVGGRNSAVEAALELYRHGARVTLVHRKPELGTSVKYWVRPDIENRIKLRQIQARFNAVLEEISPDDVLIRNTLTGEHERVKANFVFPLIGYRPDEELLRNAGVNLAERTLIPEYNPETLETNVPNLYLAGSVVCGCETFNIFIENGRAHAQPIIKNILAKA